ncbi:hypothetical protein Arno18_90 [Pectobacterium phage Arno18]|uniref:Tape measure protein n=1 Tax=Pectobacterium phage Arno18 TaxID=2500578 RepID=A0A678ZZJ6_9CAUD|nr:hypothetical protein Arno18_90 [Pectobacterium phage Arno18]
MAKYTVTEFTVELGFQEKVMAGLAKVEKQVLPIAKRIEDRLNKAFQVDGSKHMSKTFAQIVKDADVASRKINKSLQAAFNIKNAGRASVKGLEKEASAAARRIAKELQKAFNVRAPRITPPAGAGGTGSGSGASGGGSARPPRVNPVDRADARMLQHSTLMETGGFARSMRRLGMYEPEAAYQQGLTQLRAKYRGTGDFQGYYREARLLENSFREMRQRVVDNNKAVHRSQFMAHGFNESLLHLAKGFASVYAALEFFQGALEEGGKRTQAETMTKVAYGDNAKATTLAVDAVADQFGMKRVETRQQAAQLRLSMPKQIFSDEEIPKLLRTESVFAHQTGMTTEAVGRLNYAMQQIAVSTHLMGQDWMQVTNASPAMIQQLLKLTGKDSPRELKEYAKTISGADFTKLMVQAMEQLANNPEVIKAAQDNIIAVRGRLTNSILDSQNSLFLGMENGIKKIYDSLTQLLTDSGGNFEMIGQMIGYIAESLTPIIYTLDELFMNLHGWVYLLVEKVTELRKESVVWDRIFKALSEISALAIDWAAFALGMKLLKSFASTLTSLMALTGGAGAATAANAAAGGVAAATGGGLAALLTGAISAALTATVLTVTVASIADSVVNALFPDKVAAFKKMGDLGTMAQSGTLNTNLITSANSKLWEWLFGKAESDDKMEARMRARLSGLSSIPLTRPFSSPYTTTSIPPITFAPLKIEVVNKGQLEVRMPDGTMQRIAMEATTDNMDALLMSANGLAGAWQKQGNNAGFTPSLLQRNPN